MSELQDVFAIYGAIDDAVRRHPELQLVVQDFLPGYRSGGAIGWFSDFREWTKQINDEAQFVELEQALVNLSGEPASGRMAARRMLAVAVAARLQPFLLTHDAGVTFADTLAVNGIAGASDRSRAADLLELLTDPHVFGSIKDWAGLVHQAVEAGLVSADFAIQAASPPCSGTLKTVNTPGDPFPAAELKTVFDIQGIPLLAAERFLEPSNWPTCSHFWCLMHNEGPLGAPNQFLYHEIVSLSCDAPALTWWAQAMLEFSFIDIPADQGGPGKRVSYRLSPNYANSDILVDEGSLLVLQYPNNTIHVETVKCIKFAYPFSGDALAMVMCAFGYATVAENLVLDCAYQNAGNPTAAGTDFPGGTPPAAPTTEETLVPPDTDPVDEFVDNAVTKFKDCVDYYKTAYKSSCDKVKKGYTANDLVSDMACMWVHYLKEGATMVSLGLQAAQAVAAESTVPPSA